MDFLKLPVYRLSANTMGTEVGKPRFSLGGAHSSVGRPTGPRIHLFIKYLSAPYSGVRTSVQRDAHRQIPACEFEGEGGKEARNNHLPIVGNSPS